MKTGGSAAKKTFAEESTETLILFYYDGSEEVLQELLGDDK